MTENRNHVGLQQTRVTFDLPVYIQGDDTRGNAYFEQALIRNVTRRGAFIETGQNLEPGALMAFYDAQDGNHRLCYAQVVWSRKGSLVAAAGVGVRLVSDNARWIDYLVSYSIEAVEGELPVHD
jgi:hypothetical protein